MRGQGLPLAGRVLRDLLARPWERGTLWNVNLPHLLPGEPDPEVIHCPLDPSPLPLSFREEAGLFFACARLRQPAGLSEARCYFAVRYQNTPAPACRGIRRVALFPRPPCTITLPHLPSGWPSWRPIPGLKYTRKTLTCGRKI